MEWTKRRKLVALHLVILCILSVTFWGYFSKTVVFPETNGLIVALVFASGLFVWMLSGFILWKEKSIKLVGALIFTVPIFFQTTGWQAYLGGIFVALLLYLAAIMVEREERDRLTFSSSRAFLVSKQVGVLAFSLALSLGYFAFIRSLSWDDLEPRFRLGHGAIEKILEWGGYFQPELGSVVKDKKTVDEYLLSLQQSSSVSSEDEMKQFEQLSNEVGRLRAQGINVEFSGDALSSVRGVAKDSMLANGRKQLSELAGRPVKGDEQIAMVFTEVLQTKISTLLEGSRVRERISDRVLPFFITMLFFLTVWPIGLLLFSMWSAVATILIATFRSFGWMVTTKRTVMQEQLED